MRAGNSNMAEPGTGSFIFINLYICHTCIHVREKVVQSFIDKCIVFSNTNGSSSAVCL